MRKTLAVICVLCALAFGLVACRQGTGSTFEPQWNGRLVPVNQRNVTTSRNVNFENFLDMLQRMQGNDYRPLARSYVVQRQQSYQNHWYRIVYFTYPRFGSEISGPGAQQIQQYYQQQYRANTVRDDFQWLTDFDEIADSSEALVQYRLQVYAVDLLENFVSVRFVRQSHLGDGAIETELTADVFDLYSGEKLALSDVLDIETYAEAINAAVADYLRMRDIPPHEPYDVLAVENQIFSLVENGIVLLFSPGDLALAGFGVIEVLIPHDFSV